MASNQVNMECQNVARLDGSDIVLIILVLIAPA